MLQDTLVAHLPRLARECDGFCGEAANELLTLADRGDIIYIESEGGLLPSYALIAWGPWKYHMVALIDGLVYDPWSPILPCDPVTYVHRFFERQEVIVSKNGIDVYSGLGSGMTSF